MSLKSSLVTIKTALPWWAKIASKLFLARIPVSYSVWQNLGLFKNGEMAQPEYAYRVFRQHIERAGCTLRADGFVCLELGPGDSLFSAVIARAFGASRSYLVDAGAHACTDLRLYKAMIDCLAEKGMFAPGIEGLTSLDDYLEACQAHYLTNSLSSLKTIPEQSVDFIWSHVALEHIRRRHFLDTMRELRRVMAGGGVCSHRIDLRDHLGGNLNNLRWPDGLWEASLVADSGFYTNRIRYSEMLDLFSEAGFSVQVIHVDRWDTLPIGRGKLAPRFRCLPYDELSVRWFDVILRPV